MVQPFLQRAESVDFVQVPVLSAGIGCFTRAVRIGCVGFHLPFFFWKPTKWLFRISSTKGEGSRLISESAEWGKGSLFGSSLSSGGLVSVEFSSSLPAPEWLFADTETQWLKVSRRQREVRVTSGSSCTAGPHVAGTPLFGRWVWLPWLELWLHACYHWKMGHCTQELQKPTSCLRRREEKTAMYVIDTRLYTRAINSESFPLLCCLNYCWGGVREGEWLLCCIFAQKPSHRGSMEKVLTSAGSTQH